MREGGDIVVWVGYGIDGVKCRAPLALTAFTRSVDPKFWFRPLARPLLMAAVCPSHGHDKARALFKKVGKQAYIHPRKYSLQRITNYRKSISIAKRRSEISQNHLLPFKL
jgi:hypothetical protein